MKIPILFMQLRTLVPMQTADITPTGYAKNVEIRNALCRHGMSIGLITVTSAKNGIMPKIGKTCEAVCTIGEVSSESDDSRLIVNVKKRAFITEIVPDPESHLVFGVIEELPYPPITDPKIPADRVQETLVAMCSQLNALYEKALTTDPVEDVPETRKSLIENGALDELIAYIADRYKIGVPPLLQLNDPSQRLEIAMRMLNRVIEAADLRNKRMAGELERIEKENEERFRRETEEKQSEEDEYKKRIDSLDAPQEVKKKLLNELKKFTALPSMALEKHSIANYIETVLGLPWLRYSEGACELKEVARILDEDHYGLEDVKERVLEYIAVRLKNPDGKAPILCLVGAPGVGKSSIARSIARAVGKEYVRMSLGGLSDEADIRGFRRTYVGSAPGRIIYAMSKVKTSDPLMLLDEIDKVAPSAARGNVESALLEVLDPEQNSTFRDHYLELPYDLSKVFFLATANSLSSIAKPLLDRMEIIEIAGYTQDEKLAIAQKYLVRKQLAECGLAEGDVTFDDEAIRFLTERYTRESGVRELERRIGSVCRKIVKNQMIEGGDILRRVDAKAVETLLGIPPYTRDDNVIKGETGCVNGLAWTAVGGVTLPIEVRLVPAGKGELIMTGSLGDVMKESAEIALSVVRSKGAKKDEKTDVHIHVPEGATPKDGPSAGIALACALLSAFEGKKPRDSVAMTGELTLRGKVLRIGGLKEKLLAAARAGIKTVLIPSGNAPELSEMPDAVRQGLEVVPVDDIDSVFALVFGGQE